MKTPQTDCFITSMAPYGAPLAETAGIDEYIVTSSAEIDIVRTPRAQQVIEECRPKGHTGEIALVSIGCAGLFASILRFMNGPSQTARILALETPSDFVQHTLDSANLGQGGDGFVAQDTAYILDLSKSAQGAMARIGHCEILSRPGCFAGTSKLAARFIDRLDTLKQGFPGARVVTFENVSEYARRLMQAVINTLGETAKAEFAQTIEQDERHFMTVRPLLDLSHNMSCIPDQPLIVTCLGAGGRVGILAVTPELHKPTMKPVCAPHWFAQPETHHMGALPLTPGLTPPDTDAPARLAYMDRAFFGRSNFYFEWTLSQESTACTS